jgi:hypothetical protein
MSMAMMRPAPAIAAPLIAARPTPPQPMTATVSPGRTLEVWIAAPTPVITEQPIRAARSSGMSLRIATQACSWISICSAKDDRFRNCCIGPVAAFRRGSSLGVALGVGRHAQRQVAGQAGFAVAAIGRQAGDDVVARLHGADFRADLLDDAGALVAQHRRQRVRVGALHEVQVGVAEAGGLGADQHLVRARLVDLDVFDLKRLAHFAQHGGFHAIAAAPTAAEPAKLQAA